VVIVVELYCAIHVYKIRHIFSLFELMEAGDNFSLF